MPLPRSGVLIFAPPLSARDAHVRGENPSKREGHPILSPPHVRSPPVSGYDPKAIETQVAAALGRGEDLGGRQPGPARFRRLEAEVLRPGDAALPLGGTPRRPPQGVRGRRRDRPLPPPPRLRGDPPDGLRLLRPAGGEQRDQDRGAAARGDRALDRRLPPPVPRVGDLDRLVARAGDAHPRVLPLDPVDLPAPVRARPRLPRRGAGAVVPEGRHRARQRAGRRRPLRALRDAGGAAQARAVVLPDHRVRRAPARRLRPARVLARARDHDAAQLDRPLRGGRGRLSLRGAGPRLPRLHHPPRHPLRRHLLRPRPRAPRAGAAGRRHAGRGAGARVRRPGRPRVGRGARRRGPREDRRAARPQRRQPGQRRGDPDVRRRLRADGVRDRGDHGGARRTTPATTSSPRPSTCRSGA